MSFIQFMPGFIIQLQHPVLPVLQLQPPPLQLQPPMLQLQPSALPVTVIKNEPHQNKIVEIGIDDIHNMTPLKMEPSENKIVEIGIDDIRDLTLIKSEPPETKIVEIGIDDIRDLTPIKSDPPETKIVEIGIDDIHDRTPIKNEPCEILEIGINDILDASDEEIIPGITDMDSVSHAQIVESSKNLNKGAVSTDQELVQVQGLNEDSLGNLETREHLVLNFSKDLNGISIRSRKPEHSEAKEDFAKLFKIVESTSCEKDIEKIKVIGAPVIPVEPHEYTSLAEDKHVCNHCQHACHELRHLKFHISKMHRDVTTMYQCPYCPVKTKYRSSLKCHIIQKHKDTKDIHWFQCHICEMKFKLKAHLTKHTLVHLTHEQMQDKLKICPVCGKGFKLLSCMKEHKRFVHDKEPKKRVQCEKCKYTSSNKHCLKLHIIKHHKDYEQRHNLQESSPDGDMIAITRYRCDKCDYETYRPQNFSMHKLIHLKPEEIQYFYCYNCSYKSKRKGNLTNHILKHLKNGEIKHRTK